MTDEELTNVTDPDLDARIVKVREYERGAHASAIYWLNERDRWSKALGRLLAEREKRYRDRER